jgi:hypothetical protein
MVIPEMVFAKIEHGLGPTWSTMAATVGSLCSTLKRLRAEGVERNVGSKCY